jgi:hypothetical protein
MDLNDEYSVWICESSTDQKRWNINVFSYLMGSFAPWETDKNSARLIVIPNILYSTF